MEFLGRVAVLGDVGTAEVARRLHTQHVGHRVRVGVEQLLVGDARGAGEDLFVADVHGWLPVVVRGRVLRAVKRSGAAQRQTSRVIVGYLSS